MIFKLLSCVPLIGEVLRILNTYAYKGDARADDHFASAWLWLKAFGFPVGLSVIGTGFCMPEMVNAYLAECYQLQYQIGVEPSTPATSILPNLLGFGIGAYALIFGLHKLLLRELQDIYKAQRGDAKPPTGSALIVNAEMAVPLLILALTIIIGLIQQLWPSVQTLKAVSWFSLWMSLVFTVELICTLFSLGENSILKSLDSQGSNEPKE